MRKTLLLALLAISASAFSQVSPIPGPFPTAAQLMENFDAIPAGNYLSHSVFSAPAVASVFALNPAGSLAIAPPVAPQPPAFSLANTCLGQGSDLGIKVLPVMRRFGAWFRNSPNSAGVAPTFAKLQFVDSTGVVVGTAGFALTNTWVWHGWKVNPKFFEIDIFGNAGPGGVELDNIEVKPN